VVALGAGVGEPGVEQVEVGDDQGVQPQVTYRHDIVNDGDTPMTRLNRELWFETTNGPPSIEALPSPNRNIIIWRVHDTALSARFACQLFPRCNPARPPRSATPAPAAGSSTTTTGGSPSPAPPAN
jgi:hypothetical protein